MANNPPPFGLQPPTPGSLGPQSFGPPVSMQFRPAVSAQQGQPFITSQPQHYGQNVYSTDMAPGQNQPPQYSQTMQQFPQAPTQHGYPMTSAHAFPNVYGQPNRPLTSGSVQLQQSNPQFSSTMTNPGLYNFVPASHGQAQDSANPNSWPSSQSQGSYTEQILLPGGQSAAEAQQTSYSPAVPASLIPVLSSAPNASPQSSSDWQEHTATDGRRYYYNRKTKQSSWEKPLELMTPIERADASTVWKEFSTPDGKKYYYNKVTKQSKWTIPEELQLAREKAAEEAGHGTQSHTTNTDMPASTGTPVAARTPHSITKNEAMSSPNPVSPAIRSEPAASASSRSPATPASFNASVEAAVVVQPLVTPVIASPAAFPVYNGDHIFSTDVKPTPVAISDNGTSLVAAAAAAAAAAASGDDIKEAKKGMTVAGKINVTPVEEKPTELEPLQYATKQEAKIAFKALLESANVESDWTWDQAMRVIVNDKRYGALRTLGERKQAFNEYLGQRKKIEAEERRMRQKKAREEFTKMLEECQELTSSTRWREALAIFENDERFKAVERVRDREDLFDNYMVELQKKEKAMAQEKHKQDLADFRKFLESCDFIKASTQWRRVQDRLEDDERCLRLEKVDRLLAFQDYIRDLEIEEEEQKKLQKEQLRRAERKNRDAFRKLMDEHVTDGTLTAKTQWRDYCTKVKESLPYMAVASNTSGSTPKDLFEDVLQELQDKYHEDKTRIKELTKSGKLVVTSTWTFEDFKEASKEDLGLPEISDINLNLAFEELLDRIKEREEKEARKRQHLADDFSRLLRAKEIAVASSWEECKILVEDSQEYRAISDEESKKQIFKEYIVNLEEKEEKELKREMDKAKKEKEREEKDKKKDKERKDKERDREKDKDSEALIKKDDTDSENHVDSGHKEEKKRDKDRDRKHRKRRQSSVDDVSSDKEETKKSRRHGNDRKKSRRHNHSDSDSDGKHKRHKRDKDSSRKHGHDELEDGELGDEMET